jgi:hypothetical protein
MTYLRPQYISLNDIIHLKVKDEVWNVTLPHAAGIWNNPVHLFSHLHLHLSGGFFPSGFPTKMLYPFLISPICATFSAHHILDLITVTIYGRAHKIESSYCLKVYQHVFRKVKNKMTKHISM